MLPILRTISVGGVFLAIAILGLALIPPGRPHMRLADTESPARGALIDRGTHPEWRQFLILSALRRADEIERLRDLPGMPSGLPEVRNGELPQDAPATTANGGRKIAGLPTAHDDAELEAETGSINVAPSATIPIDIGTASSFELPVTPVEEMPPVTRSPVVSTTAREATITEAPSAAGAVPVEPPLSKVFVLSPPERPKTVVVIRKRGARTPSAKATAAAQTEIAMPPPFNFLQAFFASLSGKQTAAAEQPAKRTVLRRPRIKSKQTAAVR